ncbi:ABC transporter ATP-binding protein [Pseudogracilibacillus sp. SE30717A]|uniref:ABC transporter ATP-binding protein n=1 Tax=Pseudogracilibacillus sp. SE30717A TaxID=3098293 RepID=UPI00300E19D3
MTSRLNNKITMTTPLFEVRNLSLSFKKYGEGLREEETYVIRNLDFSIHEGEIIALVGASGSGKSLFVDAILGILPRNALLYGTINYKGKALSEERKKILRGKEISLIPQSIDALDPLMKVGKQVQSIIKEKNKRMIQQKVFQKLGLPDTSSERYPFELSGGMARKVLISTAMASDAKLIVADEPTSGLDEKSLQEMLYHLKQLVTKERGLLFITHDITAALEIAHKVVVFYAGQTVEIANITDFTGKGERLRHPYTKALWNALPQNSFTTLKGVDETWPAPLSGCSFVNHCPIATDRCRQGMVSIKKVIDGMVRCFYA